MFGAVEVRQQLVTAMAEYETAIAAGTKKTQKARKPIISTISPSVMTCRRHEGPSGNMGDSEGNLSWIKVKSSKIWFVKGIKIYPLTNQRDTDVKYLEI